MRRNFFGILIREAKSFPFLFLGFFFLSSCLPTPDPTPEENPLDSAKSAQSTSNSTQTGVESQNTESEERRVLGKDENGDGIRDDIEKWLKAQTYQDDRVLKTLEHLARAYQSELANAYHVQKSRQATKKAIRATDCLYSLLGPQLGHQVRNELKKKVLNNPLRQKWGRRVQMNFKGEQIAPIEDYSSKTNCSFLE